MIEGNSSSRIEWDLDDCQIPMGRKFNELRRSLVSSDSEMEQLSSSLNNGSAFLEAYRRDCRTLQAELEEVHDAIFQFPTIMDLTNQVLDNPDVPPELLHSVRLQQVQYDKDLVRAEVIERQIILMCNFIPTVIQTHIYQISDNRLKQRLDALKLFVDELLAIFGIDADIILAGGDKFAAVVIGEEGDKYAIMMIPFTKLEYPLEWFPIAHEIGHVLLDRSEIGNNLYDSFYQALVSRIGFDLERTAREYVQLVSWRWVIEVFSDLCMVEALKIAAIGFSGIHREFHSNYAFSESHPPDILRVRFMLDFANLRWQLDDFIEQYQRGFSFSKLENPEEMSGIWGLLAFWQDPLFRARILEVLTEVFNTIIGLSSMEGSFGAFLSMHNGSSLHSYTICDILSALPIFYLESNNPSCIDRIYSHILEKLSLTSE